MFLLSVRSPHAKAIFVLHSCPGMNSVYKDMPYLNVSGCQNMFEKIQLEISGGSVWWLYLHPIPRYCVHPKYYIVQAQSFRNTTITQKINLIVFFKFIFPLLKCYEKL